MQYTDPKTFVKIWNKSKTLADAAKLAGTTPLLATARAARFRRDGMKVKMFARGRRAKKSKV